MRFCKSSLCRADLFKQEVWDSYVKLATMPPLKPMLSLYKELKAFNWSIAVVSDRVEEQRNVTIKNLNNAGYEDYILILRYLDCTLKASCCDVSHCLLCM